MSSNPDQVTSRLHMLRGEAYRHQRNLRNTRVPSLRPSTHCGPSLPPALYTSETGNPEVSLPYSASTNAASISFPRKAAGPPAPRSWAPSKTNWESEQRASYRLSSAWRGKALELIFRHSSTTASSISPLRLHTSDQIPSLLHLTLHVLLHHGGIPPSLLHFIPHHILRQYVRYSAVHCPLPEEVMEVLWGIGCDGEVIVIGPGKAGLLNAAFNAANVLSAGSSIVNTTTKANADTILTDWDAPSVDDIDLDSEGVSFDPAPTPPHTFIAVSAALSPRHVSQLPTTLIHLALINVPRLPIHLLPAQVPFIEVLDLSFNIWVGESIRDSTVTLRASVLPPVLHHVEWGKWSGLRVLGLRGYGLGVVHEVGVSQDKDKSFSELGRRVNKGRLEDVEIVFDD